MSLEGCSISSRSKYAFDPSNPAGSYVMNCSNEYGQSVLLTVVEMVCLFDDLNAVARCAVHILCPMQVRRGTIVLVAGKTKWKGRSITIDANDELWTPPEDGMVEFEVQVIADDKHAKQVPFACIKLQSIIGIIDLLMMYPTAAQVYTDRDMAISVQLISGKKASRERAAVLDLVATSSKLLTCVQARVLLECLDDPMEKVSFYSRIMTKIADDPAGKATFLVLSDEEQQVLRLCVQ